MHNSKSYCKPRPFLNPCLRFKGHGRVGECFDLDKKISVPPTSTISAALMRWLTYVARQERRLGRGFIVTASVVMNLVSLSVATRMGKLWIPAQQPPLPDGASPSFNTFIQLTER